MDPFVRPRTTDGPLGYLNYPPEIMNKIYQNLFVDNSQSLAFLCSSDPQHRIIGLRRAVTSHQCPRYDCLEWTNLFDERYYTTSSGLSGQFLRVCRKIWFEASPMLYGNLTIAMRWDMRWISRLCQHQPDVQRVSQLAVPPDPCIRRFFRRNTPYVVAWAAFVYPNPGMDFSALSPNEDLTWCHVLHWGMTHRSAQRDPREQILQRLHRLKSMKSEGEKANGSD